MAIPQSLVGGAEIGNFCEVYSIYDGETYTRYTTNQFPISFGGFDYAPAHIKRDAIKRSTDFSAVTVNVTAPVEEKLIKYLSNYPVKPTTITIVRGLVSNFNSYNVTIFTGNITSVQLEDVYAVASCTSMGSVLDSYYPKNLHSTFCQNTFCDSACGLALTDYMLSFLIENIDSKGALISSSITSDIAGLYTGGYVSFINDFRWITLGETGKFNLHVPFDASVYPGITVVAYQGCDKAAATCKNRFNNLGHFFGCPYIPADNPVVWGFQ